MTTTIPHPSRSALYHPVHAFCDALERARYPVAIIYLIAVMLIVFLSTPRDLVGGDSVPTIYLSISLVRWGSFRLDPFVGKVFYFQWDTVQPHYLAESAGHYYSGYSPIPAILAAPFYAPYVWLVSQPTTMGYIVIARVVAMIISIAAALLVFLMLRYLVAQWQAALLSLAYAFSTFTWTAATTTLGTQTCAELFLTLMVLILLRDKHEQDQDRTLATGWYALAGFAIGMAVASRPQVILIAIILTGYLAQHVWPRWRLVLLYGLAAVPVIVFVGAYNAYAFGSPFTTGYQSEASRGWTTPLWVGLPSILLSPTNGLLFYSPIFAFALLGAWRCWHTRDTLLPTNTIIVRYISLACLAQLLLMSHWWAWHGGSAFYQRMLSEAHPLLFVLIAYALRHSERDPWFVRSLVAATFWGVAMHIVRISFFDPTWGENYHPEVAWTIQGMEIATYIRWHGLPGFIVGILKTALGLLVLFSVPTLLFTRLVQRQIMRHILA